MSTNDTFTGLDHFNFLDSTDLSEMLFNLLTPMSNRQTINVNFALSLAFTLTAALNIVIIALIIAIFSKLKKISKKSFGCGKDLIKQLLHLLFSMDQIGNKLSSLLFHILSIVTELAFRQNQQSNALMQLFDVIRLIAFESQRGGDPHDPHAGIGPHHGPPQLSHQPPPQPSQIPFIPFPLPTFYGPSQHGPPQYGPPPHMIAHSLPPPPPPPPPPSYHSSSPNSFPPPPPPSFSPFPSSNQINLYPISNSTYSDAYMQPAHRLGVIYDDI